MTEREKLKELKKAEKSIERREKKKLKDNWNKGRKCLECGNPISNDWNWDICGSCKHKRINPFKPKYSD